MSSLSERTQGLAARMVDRPRELQEVALIMIDGSEIRGMLHRAHGSRTLDFLNRQTEGFVAMTDALVFHGERTERVITDDERNDGRPLRTSRNEGLLALDDAAHDVFRDRQRRSALQCFELAALNVAVRSCGHSRGSPKTGASACSSTPSPRASRPLVDSTFTTQGNELSPTRSKRTTGQCGCRSASNTTAVAS